MPTPEDRIATLEKQIKDLTRQARFAFSVANALQGLPSDATLSLPHNDSLWFADNVDGSHPANFRYVIASNVQKVVSARLSIHLAAYRTYNTLSISATGTESQGHNHGHSHTEASHSHKTFGNGGTVLTPTVNNYQDGNGAGINLTTPVAFAGDYQSYSTTPGNPSTDTTGESATHTHNVSASGVLGVTEGIVAAGVTISFDGVDATAALGGPFNADVIELDVRRFLLVTQGVYHTIALQPSGNGRIEAHLRLGYYASAGQVN